MPKERKPADETRACACGRRTVDNHPTTAADLRAAAQAHALIALQALVTLAEKAASESVRVSAANAVLDRAYGKPASGARAEEGGDDDASLEVGWLDPGKS